jgi:hypothetical protein
MAKAKKSYANMSHKQRFSAIRRDCTETVQASDVKPLSKAMWDEYGSCLRSTWAGVPKKSRGKKAK